MGTFTGYREAPISEDAKIPFLNTPWAMDIIADNTLRAFINESRIVKSTTTADTFVGQTLATDSTIRAWLSFWKPPDAENEFGEVISLLSIGNGVNGHIDTSHGGFISLLMDEALGHSAENFRPDDKATMTAYLKACDAILKLQKSGVDQNANSVEYRSTISSR